MGIEYIFNITLQHYLSLGFLLFSIGLLIVMVKKNFLIILMGIELMLNGVNVIAISFGHYNSNIEGQVFAFFVLMIAVAKIGVGLIIIVSLFKNTQLSTLIKLKD